MRPAAAILSLSLATGCTVLPDGDVPPSGDARVGPTTLDWVNGLPITDHPFALGRAHSCLAFRPQSSRLSEQRRMCWGLSAQGQFGEVDDAGAVPMGGPTPDEVFDL